ncbi:MAG TPA: NUDIX hydrolase [Aggregatilineales bacterium]|nr:NUDIX hydrolase [Aggregatilineales bacterium]
MLNKLQISAGGVAFRRQADQIEVALISVGSGPRWQLPKGMVNPGETNEKAAQREVREEAGIDTELGALIDRVEYWYYASERGERVHFHKYVYFYLLRYTSGDVQNHDHEVNEARWYDIDAAYTLLTFDSERGVIVKAREMIARLG